MPQDRTFHPGAAAAAAILSALALSAIGCTIQKDKNSEGDENVKIATPFGGMQVKSDSLDASSVGLPAYPGAQLEKKKGEDSGSVDLHMGFGPWQMRVKAVSYTTPDPEAKVLAFYRQAMAKYGDVVECRGDEAVGQPTHTAEGLTCRDDDNGGKRSNPGVNINDMHHSLKAGSKRHQHIVGFKNRSSDTDFSLVLLELPNSDGSKETN